MNKKGKVTTIWWQELNQKQRKGKNQRITNQYYNENCEKAIVGARELITKMKYGNFLNTERLFDVYILDINASLRNWTSDENMLTEVLVIEINKPAILIRSLLMMIINFRDSYVNN
jgi:hypothetical protein